jgi:hypothetical protein
VNRIDVIPSHALIFSAYGSFRLLRNRRNERCLTMMRVQSLESQQDRQASVRRHSAA